MSDVILQIKNVSKRYRLGSHGTGSFRQDLQQWWTTRVKRKSNPFFGPGLAADQSSSGYIWALDDVSFDIKHGEVWGLIGPNGSGKSTLLKIISRVTRPTKGMVRGKGKISSLLEAGTGFHQELTGRENIYVSGNMLGMRKQEIQRKFDEIIEFSGVAQFIDTPMKHYSSGMYMRLAFAVAAYLEPDILIIDEVLSVGDASFQKKCLNKMHEVARDKGRTILFVSHDMQAMNQLCPKSLWLQQGKIRELGETHRVVKKYIAGLQSRSQLQYWDEPHNAPGNSSVRIKSIELVPQLANTKDQVNVETPLTIRLCIWALVQITQLSLSIQLFTSQGICVCEVMSPVLSCDKSILEGDCLIPGNFLNDGVYYLSVRVMEKGITLFDFPECLSFTVEDDQHSVKAGKKWPGIVRPAFPFNWNH